MNYHLLKDKRNGLKIKTKKLMKKKIQLKIKV